MNREDVKDYPFWEVAKKCEELETMEQANAIFKLGRCEECGQVTDIEQTGCNFLLMT